MSDKNFTLVSKDTTGASMIVIRHDPSLNQICSCPCHEPGSTIFHFAPCCEGRCSGCGSWITEKLKEHKQICNAAITDNHGNVFTRSIDIDGGIAYYCGKPVTGPDHTFISTPDGPFDVECKPPEDSGGT